MSSRDERQAIAKRVEAMSQADEQNADDLTSDQIAEHLRNRR